MKKRGPVVVPVWGIYRGLYDWVFFGIIPNHYKYYKDPKKNNQGWMESKRVFYFLFSGSLWFSVISQQKPTYFGNECGRVVKLRALFGGFFHP